MKSSKKIFLLLLALCALVACKVSKDVQATNPPLPGAFNGMPADTVSIASLPWKNYFMDSQLQGLIDSAINKNYDLQIAIKDLDKSRLLLSQSKWNNVPTADLAVSATYTRPANNSLTGLSLSAFGVNANHIEEYSASLGISWEADIWGKIHNQNRVALANYLKTSEAKKAVQTAIVSEVAQGYYNLLMLNTQLQVARQNVALNDSTLIIIKLQYEAGQVTSLAVEQAHGQQLAAAELVPQFEQNIMIQENALRVLAGTLPAPILISKSIDDVPLPENLSAGIPAVMLNRRPDIKMAEFDLAVANANVGITQAELYPALRITASGGFDSYKASNWFNIPASLFGIIGGSLLQPLLDHKELKTQFDAAKIQREQTVIRFREKVLNAVSEVSDALAKIDKLKSQEAIAANRVKILQQATKNAGMLFQNGLANYLEVIAAQGNVLQSQLELASVKRAQLTAASDLYVALGGGWQ